ncbi:MAG: sugar phosphate isomerase/epimerase family protein [Anaerolineae bacterium]
MQAAIWTGIYEEQPLDEALRTLYGHGWRAFEASTEHMVAIEQDEAPEARIAEVRACLAELGVAMPQAHAMLQADVAHRDEAKREKHVRRLARHIEIAGALGIEVIVIHPGGRQMATTRTEWERDWQLNVETFCRLGDLAGEHGLRIGLENLMGRYRAPYELLDLIAAIDHPAIAVTFDTSHANVVGLDVPAAIREFGPTLAATHISDNDGSGDQHRTPGNGQIDWPPVVAALREVGYEGLFNLEIPGERHAVLSLRAQQSRLACQVASWLVDAAPVG